MEGEENGGIIVGVRYRRVPCFSCCARVLVP